ncbi:MAG TPA: hypothetical protein VGC59_13100 [Solirubrobacteraceae bacterium]
MRILIVEDKVKMAGQLWRALRGEGMAADVLARGATGAQVDHQCPPDCAAGELP